MVSLLIADCSSTQSPEDRARDQANLQQVVDDAAATVTEFRASNDGKTIDTLLKRARGVLVYPAITRVALIGGGSGGIGVLVGKAPDGGWSSPAFMSFGGASFGLQAGVTQFSALVLVMNDEQLNDLAHGKTLFGSTARVTSGQGDTQQPVLADTTTDLFYFTRSQGGAYAGINVSGVNTEPLDERNTVYYDRPATAGEIVVARSVSSPGAAPLQEALSR
jgi:lipid-binding SYLF domain-containing protein